MSVAVSGWVVVSPGCIRLHSSDSSPDKADSCGLLRISVGVPGTFRKGEGRGEGQGVEVRGDGGMWCPLAGGSDRGGDRGCWGQAWKYWRTV